MNASIVQMLTLFAFLLSKFGIVYIAYLAVVDRVMYAGWFVFLAIAYVLGTSLHTSGKS